VLERCLAEGEVFDSESLCILPGKIKWRLQTYVHILSHSGNMTDAYFLIRFIRIWILYWWSYIKGCSWVLCDISDCQLLPWKGSDDEPSRSTTPSSIPRPSYPHSCLSLTKGSMTLYHHRLFDAAYPSLFTSFVCLFVSGSDKRRGGDISWMN